jgi:amino acid transporter
MLLVVVICSLWNLRGAPSVGRGAVALFFILLAPFAIFVALAVWHGFTLHPAIHWTETHTQAGLSTAILVAMWNYMGWDNASTVAGEVENPQRNYPRAMVLAALLVAITYIVPMLAMAFAGFSTDSFATGDWTNVAENLGGPFLALAIVIGGSLTGIGMFNALVLSYTRLPMAMAEDGMLPAAIARRNSRGVPWVSVLLCGIAWALALNLPFERLISIDLILYGSSLILEFIALVVLRIREPNLKRPFKAGNLAFACALGVGPTVLIGYALYAARDEKIGSTSSLIFATAVALLGPLLYWLMAAPLARRKLAATSTD